MDEKLRVSVEILEFDFIFEHDNAKELLELLAKYGSSSLLYKKGFRIFI